MLVYAVVDVATGIKGTAVAFSKFAQKSRVVTTCLRDDIGDWVVGFKRNFAKFRVDAPKWSKKIVQATIVVKDGLIYYADGNGVWIEIKKNLGL